MLEVASSLLVSVVRGGRGLNAMVRREQPAPLPVLYDMEGCPFCRTVREVLCELDLDVLVKPCPKGQPGFWDEVIELSGKRTVPFLVDEAHGVKMGESADIIAYLYDTYGAGQKRRWRLLPTSMLASVLRPGAGTVGRPARRPEKPLELYSFEASPFARLAREALCELGLPYILRNGGRQQPGKYGPLGPRPGPDQQPVPGTARDHLKQRTGKVQFPWLHDPNTDQGMYESRDIVRYLRQTYQL